MKPPSTSPKPADEELTRLRRHLPPPPATVWMWRETEGAQVLRDAGYQPQPWPDPGAAEEPSPAALLTPPWPRAEEVAELTRSLTPEGRALFVGPELPGELELALADAGFSLHRRPEVTVARRTPFRVRAFTNGDERAIAELFERSFHHRRSLDHWRWEYESNPYGRYRVSVATDEAGRLIAHYSGYPVRVHRPGLPPVVAHQIGDTMTAPEVRAVGRGPTSLLARTGRHFYAAFCADRVGYNFGFNVGNIQKFSIRFLDAHRVCPVTYRRRDVSPVSPRRSFWPRYRGAVVDRLDSSWDRLFATVADAYGWLVVRDATYLRWRYLERPGADYRIVAVRDRWRRLVGWAVFRRKEDRLVWGDALFDPRHPGAVAEALRVALENPLGEGASRVEGWFPPRPAGFHRCLEELGFETLPEPQDLALMCVPFTLPDAPRELAAMYYTWGDSDLF